MTEMRSLRRRVRHLATPVLGALLAGYFGYHAITGNRSLVNYWRLTQEVADVRARLAVVQAERQRIEHRVSLLRSDSLDPDMLDERARWALGYVAPGEILVLESARATDPTQLPAGLIGHQVN